MSRFDDRANEFDLYFIPVTKEDKAIKESMKTAHTLNKVGVEKDKIVFVPNRIIPGEDIEKVSEAIFSFVKETNIGKIDKNSGIYDSEVYEYLAHHKISFKSLTEEFKFRAKQFNDVDERRKMARHYTYMKQAIHVKNNLDKTYALLIGE